MSVYFSKVDLNTYRTTSYFRAHIPDNYPINLVLQKCRAFRRLPPNLRHLSAMAKRWTLKNYPDTVRGVSEWYDDEGYEIEPGTTRRLTDAEIDAQWNNPYPALANFTVVDIPAVQFADPDTWQPPPEPEEPSEYDGQSEEDILRDIRGFGREYVAKDHGIPLEDITTDEELARAVMDKMDAPTT